MKIYILITEAREKQANRIYDQIFECFPGDKTSHLEYDTPEGYMVVINNVKESTVDFLKSIKNIEILLPIN